MKNNDDLINDILNKLDGQQSSTPEADPVELLSVSPDESYGTEPETAQNAIPAETESAADEDIFRNECQNYYQDASTAGAETSEDVYAESGGAYPDIENYPADYGYPSAEEYLPRRSSAGKKKKKKKKRNRLPGVLILTTFIFAISIVLAMVIIGFGKDMLGIGKSDTTKLIIIKEGATTEQIAEQLKNEGIIKSPKFFVLFSRLRKADSMYIAGEHFIRANMAYETIIQNLTTDEEENKNAVEVTFPEGITIFDAAQILEENNVCSQEDFLFYFNAAGYGFEFEDMLPVDSQLKFKPMEGYVFPDTYYFYEEMDPEKVCQKIYLNFDNKLTDDRIKRMEELQISLDELITFASIVQKEAATTNTMTMVASVFWNRLNNPDEFPKLQSDPTTNYVNNVIKPNQEVYNKTMIEAYDTYQGAGLPPGAICNPGIEAIDAVLANQKSDYFYFIANIYTGETLFAETLEKHEANQQKINEEIAQIEAQQQGEGEGNGTE